MSSRALRTRVAELLEPRCLLAGLVKVSFNDGNLLIAGDALDNGFSIQPMADPTGERSSIAIIPDETTAINDLEPGVPLVLPAVQLENVRILPGDGDDFVGVRGLSITGGLQIDNRGGADSYKIGESNFDQFLKLNSTATGSKAELSDVTIRKTIDKSSPLLLQAVATGKHIDLKSIDLRVGGSMNWQFGKMPGKVDLQRVQIDGALSVVSTGGISDLKIEGGRLGKVDKSSPVLFLRTHNTNVDVNDLEIGGSATATFGHGSGGGAGKVSMRDFSLDGRLNVVAFGSPMDVSLHGGKSRSGHLMLFDDHKGGSRDRSSTIEIVDSHFDGSLRIESSVPTDVTTRASAAADYFLKLDGIKGESQETKHKDEIIIESFSWGESLRVESNGPTALMMKKSEGKEAYLKIKMEDILVSSYSISGSKVDGGLRVETAGNADGVVTDTSVSESVSFNYTKIKFINDQQRTSSLELKQLDIGGRLSVVSNGSPLDIAVETATAAAVDVFLKLPDIKGESKAQVHLADMTISGGLRVVGTGAPLDIAVEETTAAAVDMFLKLDGIKGESKSKVDLHDVQVGAGLSVIGSGAPVDISVEGATARGGFLKLGDIKGEFSSRGGGGSGGSVKIHDSRFDGLLRIESSGPTNVSTTSSAAADYFLKLDGIKGEATDSKHKNEIHIESFSWGSSLRVEAEGPTALTMKKSEGGEAYLKIKMEDILISSFSISDSNVDGNLRVESSGGIVHGAIEETTTEESLSLNFSKFEIKARDSREDSSVQLKGLTVGGSLSVESGGPLDMTAQSSKVGRFMYLKFGGPRSIAASSSQVDLVDVSIAEGLAVLTGAGDDQVRLERVNVGGRTEIRLDGGNDRMSIVDSVFAGPALFDGGAGEDALMLSGNKFEQLRMFLNWEKIVETGDDGTVSPTTTRALPPVLSPPGMALGRAGPGRR